MVFYISQATSQSSLNQLIQSYYNIWNGKFSIVTLYNLWYYTNTYNNNIVSCRMYYQYKKTSDFSIGYYNAYANYDTTTGLYTYQFSSGISATSVNNGLDSSQLSQLTLYYPVPISNIKINQYNQSLTPMYGLGRFGRTYSSMTISSSRGKIGSQSRIFSYMNNIGQGDAYKNYLIEAMGIKNLPKVNPWTNM